MVVEARGVTPFVLAWLRKATAVRLLHRFDHACNVVDGRGRVVSIVTAALGPGPFAIVVPDGVSFAMVDAASMIEPSTRGLRLGSLSVDVSAAQVWQPRPDWAQLHAHLAAWRERLPVLQELMGVQRPLAAGVVNVKLGQWWQDRADALAAALQANDAAQTTASVRELAGLGTGLTPAGDDVLLGAMMALWLCRPQRAGAVAQAMAAMAVARTTTLSAAWLHAAARGEADGLWHTLLAQVGGDVETWKTAVARMLARGHSSGWAALYGFTAVLSRLSVGNS